MQAPFTTGIAMVAVLLLQAPPLASHSDDVLHLEGSKLEYEIDLRGSYRLAKMALDVMNREGHIEVGTITKITSSVGAHWVVELRDKRSDGLTPRAAVRGVCWIYLDSLRGGFCHVSLGRQARPLFSGKMLHEVLRSRCDDCRLSNYWLQIRDERPHPFGPWWVVLGIKSDPGRSRVTLLINANDGEVQRFDGIDTPEWVLSADEAVHMGEPFESAHLQ